MTIKELKPCCFLTLAGLLLLLKIWVSHMGWLRIGLAVGISLFLSLFFYFFRAYLINGLNEMCSGMEEAHSLMGLPLLVLTVFYCSFCADVPQIKGLPVFAAFLLHGVNQHSHERYHQGAVVCLILGLILQLLAAVLSASAVTTVAVLCMNVTALAVLPKQFADKRSVEHNKTYILLTYLMLSVLMLLYIYDPEQIMEEVAGIVTRDSLGWGILPNREIPLSSCTVVFALIVAFIQMGIYMVGGRPSAAFALICLGYLLFTPWDAVAVVLFWMLAFYLCLEAEPVTIDVLAGMESVPENLEKRVITDYACRVRKAEDLRPLRMYLRYHPSLFAWRTYLYLVLFYMSPEEYQDALLQARKSLEMEAHDILFPEQKEKVFG